MSDGITDCRREEENNQKMEHEEGRKIIMENDRLKFRFWDEELKRYLNPETVSIINGKLAVFDPFKTVDGNAFFDQGHERKITAERCTGKTDKHKNLVYVGDVVTNGRFTASIVEHENGGWGLGCIPSGAISTLDARFLYPLEIIGNVHEEK